MHDMWAYAFVRLASVDLSPLPHQGAGSGAMDTIIRITIGIVGAISVLFIVIGGIRYIVSQGDPQAVGRAKSTIIYALIGLILAMIAQGIVAFVIGSF